MPNTKSNLFVYGSLRDPMIFKSVCNVTFSLTPLKEDAEILHAEPAFLPNHRRVTPDNVYFYAVEDNAARIEGVLIRDVPSSAMKEIDKYEGKRYRRQQVRVNTAAGSIEANAYLVSRGKMKKYFGDRFHVNLIHELWLRKRIEKFLFTHTRPGEMSHDAEIERRADRELLATTERDLVISHYRTDAVSDYFLERQLDRPRPSIKHLYSEPNALLYVANYLGMVVKQVLLNQLDEKLQSQYRFEIERMLTSERYFKRSVSLLAAMHIMNTNGPSIDLIVNQAVESMPFQNHDLIDYVKYAVDASDSLFDPRLAHSTLERIRSSLQPGLIPLGAELELSNLGYKAVTSRTSTSQAVDPAYDGFKYFNDYGLNILAWKLGGYIDDHSGSTDTGRRAGFFELAPGRLNIAGELSRPATADPWLLSQLIHEIIGFYNIKPHSLHLSFQLMKNQIGKQKVLPIGFVKCLLVLGGGLERKMSGRLWVSRIGYGEITQKQRGGELVFARTSKRQWFVGKDDVAEKIPSQAVTHVQQYKFIRLDKRATYEPLILCLKGLQISYNPGDYLSIEQLTKSIKLREDYETLKHWAAEPAQIDAQTISDFLDAVQAGLLNERHGKPVHKLHYIDWALSAIDVQLRMFNKQAEKTQSST